MIVVPLLLPHLPPWSSIQVYPFSILNTTMKLTDNSSSSVIGNIGGRGGSDYPGIRITEGKLRGIGNIQKNHHLKLQHYSLNRGTVHSNKNNNAEVFCRSHFTLIAK